MRLWGSSALATTIDRQGISGRRGLEETSRRSHPRCRHGCFRALTVIGPLRDLRLGGRGSRSTRQAHPSRALSPARGREPAAATCRPQLHLLLRGAEICRARDSARGWCGWRRRSTPISTGCASTRATCSARPSGMQAAGLRTGFFPAPTSRRPRPGRRAGPRTPRSRPSCSSISSRRARPRRPASKAPRRSGCRRLPRPGRAEKALAEREKAQEREAEARKSEAEAQKREAEQARRVAQRTMAGLAAARCSGRRMLDGSPFRDQGARPGPSRKTSPCAESDPNGQRCSATGPCCRSRARLRPSRSRRAKRAISRRRCCLRWRPCRTRGLAASVRGLPRRRRPCIRRGCGTGRRCWPGTGPGLLRVVQRRRNACGHGVR